MTTFANEADNEIMSIGTREVEQTKRGDENRVVADPNHGLTRNLLEVSRLEGDEVLVVAKSRPGFDDGCVEELTRLLNAISRGRITCPKYVVFDFAHRRQGDANGAIGFQQLVAANSELILDVPVITVAWARSFMAGADFEFASSCAMLVAERDALFSFDGDPARLFGLYASLARKIGLVKTQRLMETGAVLGAEDMRNLNLVKDVVEPRQGLPPIDDYMRRCGRHYNAAYSIFRAQRSIMTAVGFPSEGPARA
ncbi:MAG: enoyl-CoA hydratase [Methylocystis sp.]